MNPEGAGRGRGVGWRVEEAEATEGRGGEDMTTRSRRIRKNTTKKSK